MTHVELRQAFPQETPIQRVRKDLSTQAAALDRPKSNIVKKAYPKLARGQLAT